MYESVYEAMVSAGVAKKEEEEINDGTGLPSRYRLTKPEYVLFGLDIRKDPEIQYNVMAWGATCTYLGKKSPVSLEPLQRLALPPPC